MYYICTYIDCLHFHFWSSQHCIARDDEPGAAWFTRIQWHWSFPPFQNTKKTSDKSYERPSSILPFAAMAIVDCPYLHFSALPVWLLSFLMVALKRGFQVKAKVKLWIIIRGHLWKMWKWHHVIQSHILDLWNGCKNHGNSTLQKGAMCATARLDALPFYKKLMAVWCIRLLKDGAFFASCGLGMALLHHKYWQSGPFEVEGTITPWRKTWAECYDRIERKCLPRRRKSVFASAQITNSGPSSAQVTHGCLCCPEFHYQQKKTSCSFHMLCSPS